VHVYTGAIFVAVGVFAAFLIDPLFQGSRSLAWRNAVVIVSVVVLLQVPYLAHRLTRGESEAAMGAVTGSLTRVLSGSSRPELAKSLAGYAQAVRIIQIAPWSVPAAGWMLLVFGGIAAVRHARDLSLLAVTLLPQILAIAGYALFLDDLDAYYYLSLMPAAALTFVLAATSMPFPRVARGAAVALLAVSLALVPGRIRHASTMFQMPEYRILVEASRKIRSQRQPMRAIQTDFRLPPSSNPEFLFEVLGGRIDRQAPWYCVIGGDGQVSYRQVAGS
jgi:hypothetical protein